MAVRTLTFQGDEIAYVVGALTIILEQTEDRGDDIEIFGALLDRAISAMPGMPGRLDPEVAARIAKARTDKGLPA